MATALQMLERLAGVGRVFEEKKIEWYVIVDGFYLDENGVLLGPALDLDINRKGPYSPLYYYNRSWRFIGLFNVFNIPLRQQGTVLNYFEALERQWEDTKQFFTRVYFLTQKLLLQEITRRLGIPSTQPPGRPISDRKRYNAQMKIFNHLWKKVITIKCHSCTSGTNSSSGSSPQTVSSLLKTGSSPLSRNRPDVSGDGKALPHSLSEMATFPPV